MTNTMQIQNNQETILNTSFSYIEIGKMLIYSVLTLGLYPVFWFITRSDAINEMNSVKKVNRNIFILIFAVFALDIVLSFIQIFSRFHIGVFENILVSISALVFLYYVFKVRDIFEDHFNGHFKKNEEFSKAFAFLFSVLYFQHKINKLCYNVKNFK